MKEEEEKERRQLETSEIVTILADSVPGGVYFYTTLFLFIEIIY